MDKGTDSRQATSPPQACSISYPITGLGGKKRNIKVPERCIPGLCQLRRTVNDETVTHPLDSTELPAAPFFSTPRCSVNVTDPVGKLT